MFLFKRSNGFYYVIFPDKLTGKRRTKSTKCRTKTEALNFLAQFQNETVPLPTNAYLDTLEGEVLNYVSNNLSNGSYVIYKACFRYLKALLGNKPVRFITSSDIELYKETRIKTVEKTTCNIEIRTLRAIFNLALKWDWLSRNPLKDVKEFPIPEREPIAFTDNEVNLILNTIPDLTIKSIVQFALLTGCRINEILNIQLKDISLPEGIITIRNKDDFNTKNRKVRVIPISDNLMKLLQSLMKQEGNIVTLFNPEQYLFNKNGFKLNKNFVSKTFKKYLRDAGLPEKYHFHCLRHTFITKLVRAGANINYIKQLAGHTDIKTTENYVHIVIDELREAINKL